MTLFLTNIFFKLKLIYLTLPIFLFRAYLVIIAQILLHFGYDLMDIFEECFELADYFFNVSRLPLILEISAQHYPKFLRPFAGNYYGLANF